MLVRRKIGRQYYGQRVNAISPLVLWNMVMQTIGFVFFSFLISPNKRPRPHIADFVWKRRFSFLLFGLPPTRENGHRKRIFSKTLSIVKIFEMPFCCTRVVRMKTKVLENVCDTSADTRKCAYSNHRVSRGMVAQKNRKIGNSGLRK